MLILEQFNGEEVTSFFQISQNIEVLWNPDNAVGSRLVNVTIGNALLDETATYNIVTLDFLAGGGDNIFPEFSEIITLDTQDVVLTNYIIQQSPVDIALDGRISTVSSSAAR